MNVVDLFSGCGGLSFGLEQAGMKILCGVDNVPSALETFEANHSGAKGLNIDLFEEHGLREIVEFVGNRKVDLLAGGPPCQGFSLTGTRAENDPRNRLFYSMFRLAKTLRPKAILLENVPGIVNLYKGKVKDEIYRLCEEMGYNCVHKELYAPDYGVPQIRKRVFFVAFQKDFGHFSFPSPTHPPESYVTCGDAISDLPDLNKSLGSAFVPYSTDAATDYQLSMRTGSSGIYNHLGTKHTEHVIKVISQVPEGGNHKDLPPGVGDSRIFNEAWTRYHRNKPSKTIDTGHRNHFHYKWNRVPTARENARLQSFPDRFIFKGTKTQQYRQIGNAVPPQLGFILGEAIKSQLMT